MMSTYQLDEKEISYRLSQIRELPSLARSVGRLIEIIRFEIDSPEELESIIGYDQSLVAQLLMIANATLDGCRGNVGTLSKAITVIGGERVKSICTCSLAMNLISNRHMISAYQREILWKRSLAGSRIAAGMARKRPWISGEQAAVLGLIRDIGWLAMAMHFNEQFQAIFETAARRNIPPWCAEMQYGLSHSHLGKCLVTRWALPDVFKAVVEFHHCPERSRSFKREVMLLHLVDVLSHSREHPELVDEELTLFCCRGLYISEQEWLEYQENAENVWTEVDQLWELLG